MGDKPFDFSSLRSALPMSFEQGHATPMGMTQMPAPARAAGPSAWASDFLQQPMPQQAMQGTVNANMDIQAGAHQQQSVMQSTFPVTIHGFVEQRSFLLRRYAIPAIPSSV
jgi:hypothetical protein